MKKCGIITDVDEQFVYVWNNELGFKELKFPVNPENKLEPGNVVNYNQTRAIHEVQNMHDIMREPNHEFVILKSKNPKIKWKAQVRLTFAPEYTEQYQSVISKTEHMPYPVKAVAYAEDILCLENTLMMAPSYNTSEINYEVGLVYNGFITRVPKSYEIPVEEVGSLFIVLGKNFAVETDPTIANRVLQKCPWNSMQNGTNTIGAPIRSANTIFNDEFGEQSDNGSVEWDALQNETNAPAAVNPRMANANVQEQKYNNEPPIKPGMAATGNSNEPTFAPSKSAMPNAKRTFSNEFRSSTQIRRQDSPTIYDEEPLAVKSVPPDVQQINENIGLIVRTEEEYSVLWSPIHDLVRIQFGYNETDNPHNYPIYRVGEWAQYLCWEELSTIHQGLHCAHTAYYIQKLQNARAPKETLLIGKNIVAKLSLKNRRNHSRQCSLAKDDFFGNILCSAGDVLFGRQFNQNHSPVKVLAVYTEEYKYSKWVAFAYQNYENNSWEKVIGLPSFIIKREIVDFMNSRRIGAEMQPSTSQQRAPEEEPHLPISQPMMTDEEKQHYLGEKVQKSESKLDQQPLRFHQPLRSLFEEPIESQWKGPVPQTQQQNAEEEEDDGEEERSTPDSFYQNNIPRFRPPLSVTMVSGSAADDDFLMPSSNENINWNCPRPFSPPTTEELANGQWTFIVQNNGNQQEEPSSLEEEENHQNQPSQPEEDEEEENVPQQQPPMDPDVPLIDLDNFDDDFIFEYNANANAQNNNTNTFAVQQEEEEEGIVMVENGEEKTMEQQQNGIGQQNGMMGGQNGIGFGHFGTAGQQNGLGMGQQIGTMGPKNGTTMNGLPLSEEEEKLRKQREFDAFLEATVEKKKKEMKNLLEL